MNRPPPPRPGSQPPRPAPPGLTPQQGIILVLVFLLGSAALTLAGWAMFSPSLDPSAASNSANPLTDNPLPATAPAAASAVGPLPTSTAGPIPGLPPMPDACLQPQKGYQQGALLQVIDGSTLDMQIGSQGQRISFAGIEVSQNSLLAQTAAQRANELLAGQPVILIQDGSTQDSAAPGADGRLSRYLVAGGKFVNLELVRQGLARVQTDSPDQACLSALLQAQGQAQAERLGIWQPTPVPTRTFLPFVTLDSSSQAACDCSARPTCEDFSTHADAQACFNACNDYNSKLDDNHDGIACPELP